jgi:hypothetical protein
MAEDRRHKFRRNLAAEHVGAGNDARSLSHPVEMTLLKAMPVP